MKKALFLFLVIFCAKAYCQEVKVTNTETFITYFTTAKEIKDYSILKDSIEALGTRIKISSKINSGIKLILQSLYDTVQHKSENLYNRIVNDLLSKSGRMMIRNNPDAYIRQINVYLLDIKSASTEFNDKYKEITGSARGLIFIWLLKEFILPIVKGFIEEELNSLVRQKLDKYLKPLIVIKPWASL
ncbi:MAG: hypothetical protein ACXVIY_05675 [Mucilaginibacter sp.]